MAMCQAGLDLVLGGLKLQLQAESISILYRTRNMFWFFCYTGSLTTHNLVCDIRTHTDRSVDTAFSTCCEVFKIKRVVVGDGGIVAGKVV